MSTPVVDREPLWSFANTEVVRPLVTCYIEKSFLRFEPSNRVKRVNTLSKVVGFLRVLRFSIGEKIYLGKVIGVG